MKKPSPTRRWSRLKPNCYGWRQKKTRRQKKNSVEIEAYLKPSWVLSSTKNIIIIRYFHSVLYKQILQTKYVTWSHQGFISKISLIYFSFPSKCFIFSLNIFAMSNFSFTFPSIIFS